MINPKDVTFLVVDDDGMVRDILVQYLKSFGYEKILEAKDGKLALKIIHNPLQPIDVIISDWEMPNLDGLTLLRAVRKDAHRQNVKFLMVSSQSSQERMKISKAAKSHVDAYIVKPFRADMLREKIHTLVNGGVDQSSVEFEAALNRSLNEGSERPEKTGQVHIQRGPQVNEYGDVIGENHNDIDFGEVQQKADDTGLPPETYDLTQMNITLILNLAKAYKRVKWYDKALKLCDDAAQLFPDNADILCSLGHVFFLKSQFEDAERYLRKAIKIKPYHVEAHSLLSEIARLQKVV